MIKRVALAALAAAAITGGAVAAPAAYASTNASIQQPSCYGRTVRCLIASQTASPSLKYQTAPPSLKYQTASPGNEWNDPPGAVSAKPDSSGWNET